MPGDRERLAVPERVGGFFSKRVGLRHAQQTIAARAIAEAVLLYTIVFGTGRVPVCIVGEPGVARAVDGLPRKGARPA